MADFSHFCKFRDSATEWRVLGFMRWVGGYMGYRIIGAGLAGWAGIVGLAWWLADSRAHRLCPTNMLGQLLETSCAMRAIADRDYLLIVGLTVALVVLVATALHRYRPRRFANVRSVDAGPKPYPHKGTGVRAIGFGTAASAGDTPRPLKRTLRKTAVTWCSVIFILAVLVALWLRSQRHPSISEPLAIEDNYELAADRLERLAAEDAEPDQSE